MNNLIDNRQIRVFISSTFQDMQDERDYLMKRTFPKLRRLAAERNVTLTELDLRWGITEEESKSGKVVEICLREIENSIPFFIGIIGNRYGWIPEKENLSQNVTERFSSVNSYLEQHLSVTEMEMQFGVLQREEDMHAFFYIKEGQEEQDNPLMLERLKNEVRASKYPSSTYSSPNDLAQQVEHAFITLLNQIFPEGNLSEHEKEKLVQRSFISSLSSTYVKDENVFQVLDSFVANSESQHLVVTGESGLGKSALLANWAKSNANNNAFSLITYFSSNGGNQTHTRLLKYLIDEMCEKYSMNHPDGKEEEQLQSLFNLFALRKERLVIILDAVNQIAHIDQAKLLNWLPILPNNIKFVFSTLKNDITFEVFQNRKYQTFVLQPLNHIQKIALVNNYLYSFGKKLKNEQIERIVNDEQCENTLVLKTLLDEIVCFGNFEKLNEKIDYYLHGKNIPEFYEKVITRFENDYGEEFIRNVLGLIAVSRNGLTEEEIITMTGIKRLEWSDFFNGFSTHLNNQSGRLVFTHNYITQTVWGKYLSNDRDFEVLCRSKISILFNDYGIDMSMKEVPYQYDLIGDWEALHRYILQPEYLVLYMDIDELEVGKYWRHYFDASKTFSITEYADSVGLVSDSVTFLSKAIRLSDVLSLVSDRKKFGLILQDLVSEHPELESPLVYRNLALSIGGDNFVPLAMKSVELCNPEDLEELIQSNSVLASAYYDKAVVQNDEQAEKAFFEVQQKNLDLCIKHYGEFHPIVTKVYQDLSLGSKDIDLGIEYAKKAIEIGTVIFGANHPQLGRSYHYLGCLYREKEEWEAAYKYFKMGYDRWLPAYGLYHEVMIASFNNQGKALYNLGRYEEALECYKKCSTIMDKLYNEKGFSYAICDLGAARVLHSMLRDDEAIHLCKDAEQILLNDNNGSPRVNETLNEVRNFLQQLKNG